MDPVLGMERLQEAYFHRFPDHPRGITVPAIVEEATGTLVTNEFPWITHDLCHEWVDHPRADAPDLWPADLREEVEPVMQRVFTELNNGVYRCGFAGSQAAYEEADIRLFTTLVRFDVAYHGHFKCSRNKLTEMPVLWAYARDLFQTPGFGETIDFDQIKTHYYVVHTGINPTRIVPKGPDPDLWLTPHGRG